MLLFAAGRVGATDRLNSRRPASTVDHRGRIKVDPVTLQTSVPHIYAAGDVIGFPSLPRPRWSRAASPPATRSAWSRWRRRNSFPYGIYSVPEISTTGLTEEEVRTRGIPYEVGVARFRETSRGHIMGLNSGMMKMIFSTKTRRLLGVHILGEGATELIHIGQAVLNLKGTIDYFIQNTFNYPTLAEAYKIAGLDAWNRMTR
jgi:Pyruvate/2-oxoglutarate dehydrogenase complex, dihydrolipoamide dehydrogenase (E3) component, and related enzymes